MAQAKTPTTGSGTSSVLTVATKDVRVEIPTPFPTGPALDCALQMRWAPTEVRRFLRKMGIPDSRKLEAADRVAVLPATSHARFARAESLAIVQKATDAALAALAGLRAELEAARPAPSTSTWSVEVAMAFSEMLERVARAEIAEMEAAPVYAVPIFSYWLPPPAQVFLLSARAKRVDASRRSRD